MLCPPDCIAPARSPTTTALGRSCFETPSLFPLLHSQCSMVQTARRPSPWNRCRSTSADAPARQMPAANRHASPRPSVWVSGSLRVWAAETRDLWVPSCIVAPPHICKEWTSMVQVGHPCLVSLHSFNLWNAIIVLHHEPTSYPRSRQGGLLIKCLHRRST